MSIENAKNYTGSKDVYRNMNKADEKKIRDHIADLNGDKAGLAAMIDCLSKEIVELKKKREPLSEEEIEEINKSIHPKTDLPTAKILFSRAIEKHHGIGGGE